MTGSEEEAEAEVTPWATSGDLIMPLSPEVDKEGDLSRGYTMGHFW